jgi:hypothetical protein
VILELGRFLVSGYFCKCLGDFGSEKIFGQRIVVSDFKAGKIFGERIVVSNFGAGKIFDQRIFI